MIMLKISKNITITGTSLIDDKQVAYMSATISTDGTTNPNIVKTITNIELYNNHKEDIRKDFEEFEKEVHSIEDEQTKIRIKK